MMSQKDRPMLRREPKDVPVSPDPTAATSPDLDVISHWVRRRSSVHTPDLGSFIQDHAGDPRFHTPVDSQIRIRTIQFRPVSSADVPRAARKGFTHTWKPAAAPSSCSGSRSHKNGLSSPSRVSSSFDATLGDRTRPVSPLQSRVHEDYIKRKKRLEQERQWSHPAASPCVENSNDSFNGNGGGGGGPGDLSALLTASIESPSPGNATSCSAGGYTKPVSQLAAAAPSWGAYSTLSKQQQLPPPVPLVLDELLAPKTAVNISPPVVTQSHQHLSPFADASHRRVPLIAPSKAPVDQQFYEPTVALSRDTIRQLTKNREAENARREQCRAASAANAHASFASRALEQRVSAAMAVAMNRIVKLAEKQSS
jgi:hypothetical protein